MWNFITGTRNSTAIGATPDPSRTRAARCGGSSCSRCASDTTTSRCLGANSSKASYRCNSRRDSSWLASDSAIAGCLGPGTTTLTCAGGGGSSAVDRGALFLGGF